MDYQKPTRAERKKYLQEQSVIQKEAWSGLTTMQKIQSLDKRLGPNVGAIKQRTKLKVLLEKEHAVQEAKQLAKEKVKAEPKKKTSRK